MANKTDIERKQAKRDAIIDRIEAIWDTKVILLSMLDETKLDLMILALGIGGTVLNDDMIPS